MEQKRLSTLCSERHIPAELWPNIFSTLPVKSLLRFRCVSKSWLSLINDPDFCRLHLKNFKNNTDETHLLVVGGQMYTPPDSVVRCSDTFETDTQTLVTFPRHRHESYLEVVSAIDGLVLLKTSDLYGFNDLIVWNPSMRKFHDIPSLPEIEASPYSLLICVDVGLGYDPLTKDYKHVKMIFDHGNVHSVAIYTLGAASWKIIQFQGEGFSDWFWTPKKLRMKSVYLQGSLYFFVEDQQTYISELVSIDVSSEVFSCISLPDKIHFCFEGPLTLVDGGCSLAAFDFKYGTSGVVVSSTMWVLESSSMCWTIRYSFDFRVSEFLYLKKNGDILMRWIGETTSFRLATGNALLQRPFWNLVSPCNLVTREERILLQEKCPKDSRGFFVHSVCGYIESLVLLN